MRIQGITFLLLATAVPLFAIPALADAPSTFTLEAQVFDPGDPYGFSYDGPVRVDLFDDPTSGDSLWTETHMGVVVESGFLSLPLGTVNTGTLPGVLIAQAGTPLYLEVRLQGIGYTFPARIPVTSVPYALVSSEAGNAETFQNMTPDAFAYSGHDHDDVYLAIGGKAADAELLDGNDSAYFATSTHNHDTAYLSLHAKADDADKLDGEDSAYFATQSGLDTTDANLGALSTDLSTNYYSSAELDGGQLDTRYYTEAECAALFADKSDTYTKTEVDDAIAAALAALKDCPQGYERINDENITATGYYCAKGNDQMVKVGDFWVDRYEMIIVDETEYDGGSCNGSGAVYAQSGDPGASGWETYGFPQNATDATRDLYACSVENQEPTRWITWFQAQAACGASGKVMCTDAQWQLAAFGTPDPDSEVPDSDAEKCNIWTNSKPSGSTWATTNQTILGGSANQCISRYGAYDMVGNVWEWTSNWWGQGENSEDGNQADDGEFHGDGYWNVDNAESNGSYSPSNPVFPASARRGGDWANGSWAGVFALDLTHGPAVWHSATASRCCRR